MRGGAGGDRGSRTRSIIVCRDGSLIMYLINYEAIIPIEHACPAMKQARAGSSREVDRGSKEETASERIAPLDRLEEQLASRMQTEAE